MKIPDDAFIQVGMRLASARAWAFASALGTVADAERGDAANASSNRWARRASDRALDALPRCQLGDLVTDLGLGTFAFADPEPGDPRDPVRAVLRHLLRDRLVDVLRISAGQRPLWNWSSVSSIDPRGVQQGREP